VLPLPLITREQQASANSALDSRYDPVADAPHERGIVLADQDHGRYLGRMECHHAPRERVFSIPLRSVCITSAPEDWITSFYIGQKSGAEHASVLRRGCR
jgi:hypothetical protein